MNTDELKKLNQQTNAIGCYCFQAIFFGTILVMAVICLLGQLGV